MSYDFQCDWRLPFDRAERKDRVGFLTTFAIAGYPLRADLQLYSAPEDAPIQAVAAIENIAWNGTAFGALSISCYMSQNNANMLTMMGGKAGSSILDIGGWLANWDESANQWYYEFYPEGPETLTALLTNGGPEDINLNVLLEGCTISEEIDFMAYKVQFEIVPPANRLATFFLAASPTAKFSLPWGAYVGRGQWAS